MLRMSTAERPSAAAFVALLAFVGCASPNAPRPPGAIAISSSVVVAELSEFAFGVSIDSATPIPMTTSGSMRHTATGLAAGRHTVALKGLPANCTSGADMRTVELRGGDTVAVRFDVTCVRTTADVVVSISTTGLELDPDGYTVRIDGVVSRTAAVNGQFTLERVAPGTRVIELSGLAANCSPQGSISRAIGLTAGAVINVAFAVTCRATTGTLILRATRSGADLDPDGVAFAIDGGPPIRMGTAAQLIVPRIPVGLHTITVTDVEANCSLAGPGTITLTLVGADTAIVGAAETCTAIGAGVEGFAVDDLTNDTLPRTSTSTPAALDVRRISGRYAPGFLLLTLRLGAPVVSPARRASNSLYGWIQLDVDENVSTGFTPGVNSYGGNASQGVDYSLYFTGSDETSVVFIGAGGTFGAAGVIFGGDSVTIRIPLSKAGQDDGNMTLTGVIGTADRPTDIIPNTGVILARRPAGVAAAIQSATSPAHAAVRLVDSAASAGLSVWPPRPR